MNSKLVASKIEDNCNLHEPLSQKTVRMKIHLWNLLAPNRNRGATSAAAADPDQDQDVAEEPEVLEAGGVVRKISVSNYYSDY